MARILLKKRTKSVKSIKKYTVKQFTFETMKNVIIPVLCLFLQNSIAQNFQWGFGIGGNGQDVPCSIQVDSSGNVYVCSKISGNFDADPGTGIAIANATYATTFVGKYDANGNYLWHFNYNTSSEPNCLRLVDNNHFIVIGSHYGPLDLDPGSDSSIVNGPGAYMAKYDLNGNLIWGKGISNIFLGSFQMNSFFYSDHDGNIFLTGSAGSNTDFDPGPDTISINSNGVFFAKYDSSGNYILAKILQGFSNNMHGTDIATDASGNIYLTGIFNNTIDLDPDSGSANFTAAGFNNFDDIFMAKYNVSGNFLNGFQIGGIELDGGTALLLDDSANIILAGSFSGSADFDPGTSMNSKNSAQADAFIAKYDSSFNFKWVKQLGGLRDQRLTALVRNPAGGIGITGYYEANSDFDPGTGTSNTNTILGFDEIFAAFYDNEGNYIYSMGVGGPDYDHCFALAMDITGGFYLAGEFIDSMDCDPSPASSMIYSANDYDIYFAKYSSIINSVESFDEHKQAFLYPVPCKDVLYINLNEIAAPKLVTIYNYEGKQVSGKILSGKIQTIDIHELKAGMYYIKIISDNETFSGRIIKAD